MRLTKATTSESTPNIWLGLWGRDAEAHLWAAVWSAFRRRWFPPIRNLNCCLVFIQSLSRAARSSVSQKLQSQHGAFIYQSALRSWCQIIDITSCSSVSVSQTEMHVCCWVWEVHRLNLLLTFASHKCETRQRLFLLSINFVLSLGKKTSNLMKTKRHQ